MNGPRNYAEAERLLSEVTKASAHGTTPGIDTAVAMAQVHATLALAAATIDAATVTASGDPRGGDTASQAPDNAYDWSEVTS